MPYRPYPEPPHARVVGYPLLLALDAVAVVRLLAGGDPDVHQCRIAAFPGLRHVLGSHSNRYK